MGQAERQLQHSYAACSSGCWQDSTVHVTLVPILFRRSKPRNPTAPGQVSNPSSCRVTSSSIPTSACSCCCRQCDCWQLHWHKVIGWHVAIPSQSLQLATSVSHTQLPDFSSTGRRTDPQKVLFCVLKQRICPAAWFNFCPVQRVEATVVSTGPEPATLE